MLTFAVPFFARHGFEEIKGDAATPEVYAELLRSYDEGVAEFLDLDRVKPNTLGNTRMLLRLTAARPDPLEQPQLPRAAGRGRGTRSRRPGAGADGLQERRCSGRRRCPRRVRRAA